MIQTTPSRDCMTERGAERPDERRARTRTGDVSGASRMRDRTGRDLRLLLSRVAVGTPAPVGLVVHRAGAVSGVRAGGHQPGRTPAGERPAGLDGFADRRVPASGLARTRHHGGAGPAATDTEDGP